VTRGSAPAHERVVRTLRAWNIRIDEALFSADSTRVRSSRPSAPISSSTISTTHVASARQYVATGHVPFGVANE